jgi:nucleoside-diphosphate-sugar epimerase
MKVLVTGGTGYIGRWLTRRLVEDGHTVHLLLRSSAPVSLLGETGSRVVVHRDAENWRGVERAVRESNPEVTFHLASLFLPSHRPEDIGSLVRSNVLFGSEVVEAMTSLGATRLVVAGTSWQHYENADYDPVNLYAATKQAFEALLTYWAATSPLRVITLKLFDTYGPGDPRPKLVPLLVRLAASGQSAVFSPGEQLIDLVHVDDVVGAFMLAGERTAAQPMGSMETYAVTSGSPVSLKSVVALFEEAVGRRLGIQWGGRPYRTREVMRPWSRGIPLPGWKPRITLRQGFNGMVSDLVQKH